MTAVPRGQGGYAEYAVVDSALVAALPEDVDLVDAASIPLAAGTALEVLKLLHPAGSSVLVLGASGHLLALSDLGVDHAEGRRRAEEALASGSALELYERWVRAQGGEPAVEALPAAPVVRAVPAPGDGFVQGIAATAIGEVALHLGAGRVRKEDEIDHAVGSSASRSAATSWKQARLSRRSTRGRTRRPSGPSRR